MSLFKKEVKDDLAYEDPAAVKKFSVMKLLKSKFFLPVVVIVLLLVLLLVFKNVIKKQKSDLNYYDTMMSIFTNELGSFSYTFAVETGEAGSIIVENELPSIEELTPDSEATADQGGSSREFADWNKYSEVKLDNWKYPVYKVSIVGTTMSVDPLETNFKVTLATPAYNNMFTEVTVRDDVYYIDVESIYNWLSNSSDAYLMSLVDEIPHGSKWLEIPASEFAVPSRYAELGDEQNLSTAKSLVTMYRRFLVALQTSCASARGVLGDRGIEKKNDVVKLTLTGADAYGLLTAVKGISTQSGDFYNAVISSSVASGLYDENQQAQAMREKDNFIEAMSDLAVSSQLCNPENMKLMATGHVRQYINGFNNNQIEGALGVQFCNNGKDYLLKFIGVRSGDPRDIVVPSGSKTTENVEMYLQCLYKVIDYLNFTNIKTDVKLNINPDTLSGSVLDQFIDLVNSTGSAEYWVTRDNVSEFIEKYKDMKQSDASNENDVKNIILVSDLVEALDKVVPRGVVTEPIDVPIVTPPVEEEERYPNIILDNEGVRLTIKYNEEFSNHSLFVLDCEVINTTDEAVTYHCKDFAVRDLLSSICPANNETLIRNYDNLFDMSILAGDIEVQSKGWNAFKLYFVIPDDAGHMDLFYGEEKLGSVILF